MLMYENNYALLKYHSHLNISHTPERARIRALIITHIRTLIAPDAIIPRCTSRHASPNETVTGFGCAHAVAICGTVWTPGTTRTFLKGMLTSMFYTKPVAFDDLVLCFVNQYMSIPTRIPECNRTALNTLITMQHDQYFRWHFQCPFC